MSTDLFDDSDLEAEDYEWDAFAPDPDEAVLDTSAPPEGDESELEIDDSDYDWEAALDEDPETDPADAEADARVAAALDRMQDSLQRRSPEEATEEAEPAVSEGGQEEEPELVLIPESEVRVSDEESDEDVDAEGEEPELVLLPDPDELVAADGAIATADTLVPSDDPADATAQDEREEFDPDLAAELTAELTAELAAELTDEITAKLTGQLDDTAAAEVEQDEAHVPSDEEATTSGAEPDDAELDDAELDDAELDDAGLDDAGLDDAGLDEAGLDEAATSGAEPDDAELDDANAVWEGQTAEDAGAQAQDIETQPESTGAAWESVAPSPGEEAESAGDGALAGSGAAAAAGRWRASDAADIEAEWDEWGKEPGPEGPAAPVDPDDGIHPEFEDPLEAARGPAHAGVRRHSGVFVATVVIACLFLAAMGAAGIARALHHPTDASVGAPARSAPAATSSSAVARLQTATDDADSATTTARAGLASLPGFPTPANVAAVVNPYVASLRLYETFLSGATIPAAAQSTAETAMTELRQDVAHFNSINNLPPLGLGAYLLQFATDVTHLQETLGALEGELRVAATP